MRLPVAQAFGSPYRAGRACGEAFATGIGNALAFFTENPEALGRPLQDAVSRLTPYVDRARGAFPDLVQEMEGMADGAGVEFEAIAMLNCVEELWPSVEACTTIRCGRFLLHAEQWYAGHSDTGVVMQMPPDGPAFISPTVAGCLPAVGLSAAGFAQGIDSLRGRDDRVGVPRGLVSRACLGARSLDEAISIATMPGRAGGYAHTFVTADDGLVVETTSNGHGCSRTLNAHANHYIVMHIEEEPSEGSLSRQRRAIELLNDPPKTLQDCMRVLSDHIGGPQSICLHEDNPVLDATVFGMVCDLASKIIAVSDGPPCRGRWSHFSLFDTSMLAGRVG